MTSKPILAMLGLLTAVSACAQGTSNYASRSAPQTHKSQPTEPVSLTINGFNYTDRVIELFSINGQGGGNIAVSSPTSGGGKTTCCITWHPAITLPTPVEIEWLRYVNDKGLWCRKVVMLNGPIPENPDAVGVHFMPDGNIIVEITDGYPDIKLQLSRFRPDQRKESGNVIHDEQAANCKYGK